MDRSMTAILKDQPTRPDAPLVVRPMPGELKFTRPDDFYHELRRRVDEYFRSSGLKRRDCPRMYIKTAVILGWFAASYGLLLFAAPTWWVALPLGLSLSLSMAAIGFNIMHDGGHGAYSDRPWVNKLMALGLDMLGGSSYMWDQQHNVMHHSYANITGHDEDINLGFMGRVSPHQRRFAFHRLQHFYLWALYGMLPLKWQLYDDFHNFVTGRIGNHRFKRPSGGNFAIFVLGKAVFFTLALVIPTLVLHSFWSAFACYAAVSWVQGLALSIVFQVPHCGEESAFPMPREDTGRMETPWAVHQVQTTVDYAQGNRLLSWYVGGLNFQIEHHLFPRICHIHYAAIAPLVEATCRDFGLQYKAYATFRAGVKSHYRLLRRMGRAE
jgi:linoleoyl-CoA desaturase